MKNTIIKWFIGVGLTAVFTAATASEFSAVTIDPLWDGKNVPKGQQCQRFGGESPMSPQIKISNIPEGTEAIVVKFNDESYYDMNYGGHGKLAMVIEPGATEVLFPAIAGHSYDLPEGVIMISAHKAPHWDKEGAYMPPCSGGKRNKYTATIEASKVKNLEKKKFKKIQRTKVKLGKY